MPKTAPRLTVCAAILAMAGLAVTTGCGHGKRTVDVTDSTPTAADSLAAARAHLLVPFADTVYASAADVHAVVTVYDTLTPGTVDNLGDMYADAPGTMTLRRGPWRDARFGGHVTGTPAEIVIDWKFVTDEDYTPTEYGAWGGGTGWTGQPLYVEWPDSCVTRQRRGGGMTADFSPREVIVGSLACKVYFINFETGLPSRRPIDTGGNPVKGTVSLDPTLNGNLYVGQGVPAHRPFGALVMDLNSHRVTDFVAEDPRARRRWGAYDSSPLRVGRFVFRPGENGIIYKYTVTPGHLRLHSTLLYTAGWASPGIEASMVAYRNYGYTGDNHGHVVCFDLNTLQPVWHYDLGDDIDATPVLAEEDGVPYLYVCCEVDRQAEGQARMAKLRADNGTPVWVNSTDAVRHDKDGKHFDGGYYGTPLLGTADCDSLIYDHCVLNAHERQNGVFVAIDRRTGRQVWSRELRGYGWSSPVAFTNDSGQMFVFAADCYGWCYVMRGTDGELLAQKHVGSNFESSPVVVGNSLVMGSRGNTIYKMSIK